MLVINPSNLFLYYKGLVIAMRMRARVVLVVESLVADVLPN